MRTGNTNGLTLRAVLAALIQLAATSIQAAPDHVETGDGDGGGSSSRAPFTAKVINGALSNFPAVVRLALPGGGSCTATLVGRKSIVTASHCVRRNGGAITVRLLGGRSVRAVCEKSPASLQNPPSANGQMSAAAIRSDVAACRLDEEVGDIDSACIGQPLNAPTEGLVVGFGTTNDGPRPFFDGRQRQGKVQIRARRNGIIQAFNNDLSLGNEAVLGAGDSGGFAGTRDDTGRLMVSAINSAGNAEAVDQFGRPVLRLRAGSLFTDLMTQTSQDFLADFGKRNGVSLCGVEGTADGAPVAGNPAGAPPPPAGNPTPPVRDRAPASADGALVAAVTPNGFASTRLGVRSGDKFEVIGGRSVRSARDAVQGLREFLAGNGSDLRLRIRRADGTVRDMTLRFPPPNSNQARILRQNFLLGVQLRSA